MKKLVVIIILTSAVAYFYNKQQSLENDIVKLNKEIKDLHKRDSLFAKHYETCSFIARDNIGVGYNNYLQVKSSSDLNYIELVQKK